MKKTKKQSKKVLWSRGGMLLAWLAVIFSFSAIHGSEYAYSEPTVWYFLERKGAHVVEYAILMLLSVRFFSALFSYESFRRILVLSGCFSLMYGVTDELHQFFVPQRGAKITDVFIDFLGIVLAAAFLLFLEQAFREKKKEQEAKKKIGKKKSPAVPRKK